jgi:hypothetical protein
MSCKSCSSTNRFVLQAEIAFHLKDIGTPHVFVFSEILVCLDCGFAELVIVEDKLRVLAEDSISDGGKKGNQSTARRRSSQMNSPIAGPEIV